MSWYNEAIAVFIARVILGILFFAQGYDKIFKVKLSGVIATFRQPMESRNVPDGLLSIAAYYTSYAELIGGLLLIIGLAKTFVLAALGLDLILVAAAFSILKPMWDMQHFFPRLLLLIFILVSPAGWDVMSADHLLKLFRIVTH
jgi:putative oxidoreductase